LLIAKLYFIVVKEFSIIFLYPFHTPINLVWFWNWGCAWCGIHCVKGGCYCWSSKNMVYSLIFIPNFWLCCFGFHI